MYATVAGVLATTIVHIPFQVLKNGYINCRLDVNQVIDCAIAKKLQPIRKNFQFM